MRAAVLFFLSVAAALGQTVPGRYLVVLAGAPAASVATARRPAARAALRQAQSAVRRLVPDHGGAVLDGMDTALNALIVSIPDARAVELAQLPGVSQVYPVRRVRLTLDHALPLHQVPAAWAALPLGQSGAGAGIKIGMIDTGIDPNNPAFSAQLPAVSGFPKVLAASDTPFTNAKIIVAKNYTPLLVDGGDPDANDHFGHGTGTSMAAAGGPAVSPFGPIVGVAPQAYLGNYKVSDANGSQTDVIAKALDDAVADGMDVINISLGGYVISYSDVSLSNPVIAALEAAANAGVVVTVSAGNDGPGPGTMADLASAPDVIAAGAIGNDRSLGTSVTVGGVSPYESLPGNGPKPTAPVTGPLFDAAALDPTGQLCSPLPSASVSGMVVLVLRGVCTFAAKVANAAAGGALAAVVYNNVATGLVSMDVAGDTLPAVFIAQPDGADLKARIAASPGLPVTLDFSGATAFPARPDLVDFSSRGPSAGAALKPDLVAVGNQLVTAAQNTFPSGELYDPSGFVDVGGTSYSAPLVAGAAAILKGARPGLTTAQYRSLLVNTAAPATAGPSLPATIQQAGTGVLNAAAALSATVTAYPTSLNFGTAGGSFNQFLNLTLSNVGTAVDTWSLTVVPTGNSPSPVSSATTLRIAAGGTQQVSLSLNAAGLAPGEYQGFLQVAGTANPAVASIPYWFAVPGDTPAGIAVLYQDNSETAHATASGAVLFRVVDVAGLPFAGAATPKVTVSSGDGTIRRTYPVGNIPGTYAIDIRAGTAALQLQITIGTITQTVVIPVS